MTGTVTSTKMTKTVVVTVERRWQHPIYKKIVKKHKKYLAHDEIGVKVGEKVSIKETKPISKRKKWKILERIDSKTKKSLTRKKK